MAGITDSSILAWFEALDLELYVPDGRDVATVSVADLLRNGVILCRLLNKMIPNIITKIHTSSLLHYPSRQFLCSENIKRFLNSCKSEFQMSEAELANEDDIYNMTNFDMTVRMLATLSKKSIEKKIAVPPLDRSTPKPPPKKMTPEEFRAKIVDEIRLTEQGYVKDLMYLIQAYMKPIRQQPWLHKDDYKKLFGNIIDIFEFQKIFYKKLAETTSKPADDQRIGSVFLDHKESFKVYTMYCANHPNAVATLLRLGNNPKWKAFGESWTKSNAGKLFDLGSSLIKPIQRICKYPLLLRELIKHTPESHHDYEDINDSMDAMNGVTMYINEMKRKMENLQVMVDLQSKIHNWSGPTLVSSGELIQDGLITLNEEVAGKVEKTQVYLLFLDKQTVICKKSKKKGEYEFKKSAPSEYLTLHNLSEEKLPNGFNIIAGVPSASEVWSFQCKNTQEKQQWLASFSKKIAVDPAGFKSTSIVVGAVTQTDTTSKHNADSLSKSKIRLPFNRIKNFSDDQLADELDKQQEELESLQKYTENMFDVPKSTERTLRDRQSNVEELKAEIKRRAAAAAPPASATAPAAAAAAAAAAASTPSATPPVAVKAPASVTATKSATLSSSPGGSTNTRGSLTGVFPPASPSAGASGTTPTSSTFESAREARRHTISDMEEVLADFESINIEALPAISEAEEAEPISSSTPAETAEQAAEASAMEQLAGELEDTRTKCAHCNQSISDEEVGILAFGKNFHAEHFCCVSCNKNLNGLTSYEKDGKPYCDDDYQRLFNSCASCSEPIRDAEFVTIGESNGAMRWHKDHFACLQCKESLLSQKIYERLGQLYCEKDFRALFGMECGLCGQLISGKYLMALEKQWHETCFVCNYPECRTPFPDGRFYNYQNSPYCEFHFHKVNGSLCGECSKPVTNRHIMSSTGKYHPECFFCSNCRRLMDVSEPVQEVVTGGQAKFLCGKCV